jgi:hypothetical protein
MVVWWFEGEGEGMALTNEELRRVAEVGVKVIELQLSLASKTAEEAFLQIWVIGYCYGAFEALAGKHGMDMVETAAFITIGFQELLLEDDGRKRYERAYKLQTNTGFIEGRAHGFDDFSRFLAQRDFRPLMLMNYFSFGKPAPLKE